LTATIALAREGKLLTDRSELAAIDSTGMNAGSASTYFSHRTGRRYHRFPKVSAVIDVQQRAYQAIGKIHWEGCHYRHDIASKAISGPATGA